MVIVDALAKMRGQASWDYIFSYTSISAYAGICIISSTYCNQNIATGVCLATSGCWYQYNLDDYKFYVLR